MSSSFVINIDNEIGAVHFMELQNICRKVLTDDYNFKNSVAAYDNSIFFIIHDDVDADTLGSCLNEIGRQIGIYMHDKKLTTTDTES